jgi:hypothetical protein
MCRKEHVWKVAACLTHGIYFETRIGVFRKKLFYDGFLGGFTFAVKETDAL